MYLKNGKMYPTVIADYVLGSIIIALTALFISGYFMNFQNLWEYWPESGQFSDVPMQWIISIVGVFLVPIGIFTGWFF